MGERGRREGEGVRGPTKVGKRGGAGDERGRRGEGGERRAEGKEGAGWVGGREWNFVLCLACRMAWSSTASALSLKVMRGSTDSNMPNSS